MVNHSSDVTGVLIRGKFRHRGKRMCTHTMNGLVMTEAETGVTARTPRTAEPCQKSEEVRKNSPLEASEKAWACQHLDFRLLASGTWRK